MVVRHLLLDADGVVQGHGRGENGFALALGAYVEQPEAAFTRLAGREARWLTGGIGWPEDLARGLIELGISAPAEEVHRVVWRDVRVHAETLELVASLRRAGWSVHLASNQEVHRASYLRTVLGYDAAFERSFFSCDVGLAKPDPRFFASVVAALAATPGDVLLVDDAPANVEGARAAGLAAEVWDLTLGIDALTGLLAEHGVRVVA